MTRLLGNAADAIKCFSRPDAIKRHKNSARSRGSQGEACANGTIEEVEHVEGEVKSAKDGRHAKDME